MQLQRNILYLSGGALPRDYRRFGVFELSTVDRYKVQRLIDFGNSVPTQRDLDDRARSLARIVRSTKSESALIEIPSLLCSRVEDQLKVMRITPLYAIGFVQKYSVICENYDHERFDKPIVKAKFVLRGMVEA